MEDFDPSTDNLDGEIDSSEFSIIEVGGLHTHGALQRIDYHHSDSDDYSAYLSDPGEASSFDQQVQLNDPMRGLGNYRFPCFTIPFDPNVLIDLDGDGIADQTIWGTKVIPIESYMRADGTWVDGHYRTIPDNTEMNNLNQPQ